VDDAPAKPPFGNLAARAGEVGGRFAIQVEQHPAGDCRLHPESAHAVFVGGMDEVGVDRPLIGRGRGLGVPGLVGADKPLEK